MVTVVVHGPTGALSALLKNISDLLVGRQKDGLSILTDFGESALNAGWFGCVDTNAIRDDLKMIIDNLLARENLSALSRFGRRCGHVFPSRLKYVPGDGCRL